MRGGSLRDQDHVYVKHHCFAFGEGTLAVGKRGTAAPLHPNGSEGDGSWRVRTDPLSARCGESCACRIHVIEQGPLLHLSCQPVK